MACSNREVQIWQANAIEVLRLKNSRRLRFRECRDVKCRSVRGDWGKRRGEGANDDNERVLRNVEKYYYLIERIKERMKESGRRHASRWRGVDARCKRSAETGWGRRRKGTKSEIMQSHTRTQASARLDGRSPVGSPSSKTRAQGPRPLGTS
jgi:hypothetical protein